MTVIYLIAGENSGDFIGSKIIEKLKLLSSDLIFIGVGGRLMINAGLKDSLFPIEEINIMGFLEILPKILKFKRLLNNTIKDILKKKPDIIITIDSPGFTFRIAKALRKSGKLKAKLIHIVAPSVWAYKPQRAKKYADIYDHLLVLLPFEPQYFLPLGIGCTYIGHPILEQKFFPKSPSMDNNMLSICVTPGSRKNEIQTMVPIFIESLDLLALDIPNLSATFVIVSEHHKELILPFLHNSRFTYVFSTDKLKIFAESDFALAKSGTNTLEISASYTPLVIGYKINFFSYLIIKLLIKIKYVSLINIISNKMVIPELIQYKFTAKNIQATLLRMINNKEYPDLQVSESIKILKTLGLDNDNLPSMKAALTIMNILSQK